VLRQIKSKLSFKRVAAFIGLLGIIVLSLSMRTAGQSITQGYTANKILQRGTVVSIDAKDTSKVVAATSENAKRLQGVVVGANDSALTLSATKEKTFVASIGRFDVLVGTEAGAINPGDFITISSIAGIAKKAGENDRFVVGKAILGFDGRTNVISTVELKNVAGGSRPVAIGRIRVDISVGPNPLAKSTQSNLPSFLKKATETIAGGQVSPVRVYVGLFILLAAASISGSLLYVGIRSSVISIGRNPLSKKSITKSLLQIVLTSIIIFLVGLFGVYLLLRL